MAHYPPGDGPGEFAPALAPKGLPTFLSARGGPRPEYINIEGADVPWGVYESISRHTSGSPIPASVALRVAHAENRRFDAEAVTREPAGGYSTGIFQLYSRGVGAPWSVSELKDLELNIAIAISEMERRYAESGTLWGALQSWSVRYLVLEGGIDGN